MYTNGRITCQLLNTQVTKSSIFLFNYRTHFSKRRINVMIIPNRWSHGKKATTGTFSLVRWSKMLWSKMFGKYLFATNVIGSGVLMVVGDIIAQEYEYHRALRQGDRFDYDRIWRMFIAGALQGPLHHWVYNWMDRAMPQRTFRTTIQKILIDQFFMSPICIVIFFYSICLLEHQSLECTHNELTRKFPYIYLIDWMTWPAAQYINFRYLETKYRVAFVNVCTAIYNVFISYMKHDFGLQLPLELVNENNKSKDGISIKGQ